MITPAWQLTAQLGAERVLNSIPEGLLIVAFAWMLLRVVGRQNSGTRFAVWFSALLAVVALPFVPAMPALDTTGTVNQAHHPGIMLPGFWAVAFLVTWTLIATIAATRVAVGLWKLRGLRRNSLAIATLELHPVLRETVEQFKTTRPAAICSSSEVRVPTVIGFFKPVILIPEWALRELSAEELKVILLHELAHLRRWDDWTNLAQKLVRTVFFFHPAVWWIEKRLSLEREMACDDVVVAQTRNPRAYAECLVVLAEKSFGRRAMAMAQAAISHARETSLRLAQILDVNRPDAIGIFKPALAVVAAFTALCFVVLPHAPRLVTFQDAATSAPVSISADMMAAAETMPRLPQVVGIPAMAKANNASAPQAATHGAPVLTADRSFKLIQMAVARQQQMQQRPALFVRTAAKQAAPVPQFLVVMQVTQYNQRGAAVMRFCVWQVTFAPGAQNAVQPEVTPKSI
ncbi:MAG TPA: M56 family metallopeptidase [Terriglobales bacterium]|jgi:beta-lactamase regulating signal transducer with metallopeptidase domain|nr:M56 family metallopeptidase [Terriglobales bacterium]